MHCHVCVNMPVNQYDSDLYICHHIKALVGLPRPIIRSVDTSQNAAKKTIGLQAIFYIVSTVLKLIINLITLYQSHWLLSNVFHLFQ